MPITSVRVSGEQVLIGTADGRTYRAGYLDAVRCRRVFNLTAFRWRNIQPEDRRYGAMICSAQCER